MLELEFIPLKTADGAARGHARVRGGYVEAVLRNGRDGEVLIITDTGTFSGRPGARIRMNGAVQAVALHEGETLLCCGFARNSALTLPEVRRRLVPARPRREIVTDAIPAQPVFEKGPGPAPVVVAEAAVEAPRADTARTQADDGLPFFPDTAVKQALSRLASETAEEFMEAVLPSRRMPVSVPATAIVRGSTAAHEQAARPAPKTAEETASDTEAFSALLARAEAVFQKIAARPEELAAMPEARTEAFAPPEPVAPEPVREPAPEREPREAAATPADGWQAACDRLIAKSEPRSARTAAQNPFPHIFPGARFAKEPFADGETALCGDWMSGGEPVTITAVPGEYSPRPPARLAGFTRYIRTRSGGYWVRVEQK